MTRLFAALSLLLSLLTGCYASHASGTFSGVCATLVRATEAGATCAGEPRTSPPTTCDPRAGLICSTVDGTSGVCVAE